MPKPNLLFLMPDQLRADYLSCYGAPFIQTPHIDSLAQRGGVLYRHAYSPSPICVPARVALMTGMDAIANGVLDNGQFLRSDYAQCGIQTWPEILHAGGYRAAAIGKMHFYPWEAKLGFQERIIAEDKVWIHIQDDYQDYLKQRGYRKTMGHERPDYHAYHQAIVSDQPWECQVDHFVGQETCRYIRAYRDERPFALMVGFPGPHFPYDPAAEFAAQFDADKMPDSVPEVPEDTLLLRGPGPHSGGRPWYEVKNPEFTEAHKKRIRAFYAALVKQIDHEVGCILEVLRERGMLDNTVILFSSDHGDYLGDHGLMGKGSFYEESARVPLLVRLPWATEAKVSTELVTLTDVTATMLHFGGCPIPKYVDSIPLPALGVPDEVHRDMIVGALAGGWMILDQEWKLCKYARGGALLFNRLADPQEQHNLARDTRYLAVYQRLDAALTRAIMRAVNLSHADKRLYTTSLSSDPHFGALGWERRYPGKINV